MDAPRGSSEDRWEKRFGCNASTPTGDRRRALRAGAVVLGTGSVEVRQAFAVVGLAVASADGLTAGRNAIDEASVDAGERDEREFIGEVGGMQAGVGVTSESAVIGIDDSFN